MKINETIRKKRKELGLTQEQVAEYLSITTPAVNKWEKGNSYPDITLLPALARILKTDLNTLLAFKDDLTDIEITNFANLVAKIVEEQNYSKGFEIGLKKITEYPTCEKLIASIVPYLDGALYLYHVDNPEKYKEQLMSFYKPLLNSEVPHIRELAISMLIARNMEQENYTMAEELINSLQPSNIDKHCYLASLYTKQGKYDQAKEIWQENLLKMTSDIQKPLMGLMQIALDENRQEDADFLAKQYYDFTKQFFPMEWLCYTAQFELAVKRQDCDACIDLLKKILSSLKANKINCDMPLYNSICNNISHSFTEQFLTSMTKDLHSSHEFNFLRGNKEFQEIISSL